MKYATTGNATFKYASLTRDSDKYDENYLEARKRAVRVLQAQIQGIESGRYVSFTNTFTGVTEDGYVNVDSLCFDDEFLHSAQSAVLPMGDSAYQFHQDLIRYFVPTVTGTRTEVFFNNGLHGTHADACMSVLLPETDTILDVLNNE